ncbi:DUF1156 domain-containing protein [Nocardia sp. NPDC052278]|uniref:DUF1156 domain-containing protein n=1 Tax=unclassified Nocardia TaxID=2637762 RepID=UPI00368DEE92
MTTNPGYKKKLIEVALPLKEISKQSAREKSIRHGHPSTLHLWWSRKPLAAARAVLFAQLVDDPSSRPEEFRTDEDQKLERKRLFRIIERLVDWDNINDEALYKEARAEIWKSCDGNPPPILDPFAGGGSIPLEAQRFGLEAHASDLNPVAVLLNRALIEIPPKWAGQPPLFPGAEESRMGNWPGATGLAEDVRRYGEWMRDEAEKLIGHRYPKAKLEDGTKANVIAWIWARTITCPNPACGGTMPLVNKFWLGKKKGKERWVEPIVEGKAVRFEIRGPKGEVREGTVNRNGAVCLICNGPAPLSYIRAEGKAGRIGAQLMAIAAEGKRMRYYLAPTEEHEQAAQVPRPDTGPDGSLPEEALGFRVQGYGMSEWADLFTDRQLVALTTLSDLVTQTRDKIIFDAESSGLILGDGGHATEYADDIATYLGIIVSKAADRLSNICGWDCSTKTEGTRNVFARQAVSMAWDFSEANPFVDASGGFLKSIDSAVQVLLYLPARTQGFPIQADATSRTYHDMMVSTDPPYYDNVPYSDIADFFYVWLRRSLVPILPSVFSTMLTPKSEELVADPFRRGGKQKATEYFEDGFHRTFARIREGALMPYPITIFYAFKQAEAEGESEASTGWETLLEGMIRAGWSITATWPLRTELGNRMRSIDSNALASSVVLACRPQPEDAGSIDRRGLITALKSELPDSLRELQQGGVAPVDLAQAAIGPGMAVYSRYSRVVEADGSPMRVRAALALINQMLAEVLSEQEGDFDADTRFCLKWFEQYAFNQGPYGDGESLSKSVNTSVEGVARAGVLWARAGKVQLIEAGELPAAYDPTHDDRISVWEVVMHLAKRLSEQGGLDAAAALMAAAKTRIDMDTAKELTYLLYSICERKKWAKTALLFNELGTSWPDIERASRTAVPVSDELTLNFEGED